MSTCLSGLDFYGLPLPWTTLLCSSTFCRIIFLQYIVDDRRRYLYNITVHFCKCYLSMIQYQIPSLKAHHNRFFRYGEWIKSLIDESLDRYSCNPRTSQCTGLEHPWDCETRSVQCIPDCVIYTDEPRSHVFSLSRQYFLGDCALRRVTLQSPLKTPDFSYALLFFSDLQCSSFHDHPIYWLNSSTNSFPSCRIWTTGSCIFWKDQLLVWLEFNLKHYYQFFLLFIKFPCFCHFSNSGFFR